MQSQFDASRLVDLVYGSLLGESSWQAFLDELSQTVPDGRAVLFYHDTVFGAGALHMVSGLTPEDITEYNSHYSSTNPWMKRSANRTVGQVVVAEAMMPRCELLKTEYYNDYLRKRGVVTGIGVTLFREESCNFLLSLNCAEVDEQQLQRAADCLQGLVPHLRRAFNHYRHDRQSALALSAGTGLSEAMRVGVLSLGTGGKVRSANPVASRLCELSSGIWIDAAGRFRCAAPAVTDYIGALLARWPHSNPGSGAKSFLVNRNGDLPLRLTVVGPRRADEEAFFRGPACTVLIEAPQLDCASAIEEFAVLHRVTAAEKRIIAGVVAGLTLADIAHGAGTSLTTVRTQLKQIFAKTGLRRQIDLVRHVHSLAAGCIDRAALGGEPVLENWNSAVGAAVSMSARRCSKIG